MFKPMNQRKMIGGVLGALAVALLCLMPAAPGQAEVCNIKVVTDANPDYNDIGSMIHSITDNWTETKDKCWAVWYWNHIARRQTAPMILHGKELADPIRQFNDYGYTMCSTIAGTNCAIFGAMGMNVQFWDITAHTVMQVEYDGAFHMFDSSLSALYTKCDGTTLASIPEIGAPGACEASGGKVEDGHIAKYHCLAGSSPNGFLTGCDTQRSLADEYKCFTPKWLKYRFYLNDWDLGHRYILNLHDGEVYTRYYHRMDENSKNAVMQNERRPKFLADPAYFVPNKGKDPESSQPRYGIRGNGLRNWTPPMTADGLAKNDSSMSGVRVDGGAVMPAQAGQAGEVVFKVQGANVITSLAIKAAFERKTDADVNAVSVSVSNGLTWQEVWKNDKTGAVPAQINLIQEVNGSYEVLVKVQLMGKANASDAQLKSIAFDTITMLNSKTQPRLKLGKNTVYVGAGEQTESIVFWPELLGEAWKPYAVDQQNVRIAEDPKSWLGTMILAEGGKEGYITFKIDAPGDITGFTYGGRFYNREKDSHHDLLHSFDGGKTWEKDYSLTDVTSPWDIIHYEKITKVPPGTRSVMFKYFMEGRATQAQAMVVGLYAVRMEVNYKPADIAFQPIEVTYAWNERQEDYSTVTRSHTQLVEKVPFTYTINVGGVDHPVMESLKVNLKGAAGGDVKYGYSDGKDNADAKKFVDRWVTYGKILSTGKPYTATEKSEESNGSGDPDGKRLTDGVVGSTYVDGVSYRYAVKYNNKQKPEVTVDLQKPEKCGAFRIQLGGYPAWDGLKGQIKDQVEVLTSKDGKEFTSQGMFNFNLRWKDIPANYMWPDDETLAGYNHELILKEPVEAQFVKFKITPVRGGLSVSEVQVLDSIQYALFDLGIALPDGKDRSDITQYNPKHTPSKPYTANIPASQPAQ